MNCDFSYTSTLEHMFFVEALDTNGQSFPWTRSAKTTVELNVLDTNDNAPVFTKRKYQGFMSADLARLRNDLSVQVDNLGVLNY